MVPCTSVSTIIDSQRVQSFQMHLWFQFVSCWLHGPCSKWVSLVRPLVADGSVFYCFAMKIHFICFQKKRVAYLCHCPVDFSVSRVSNKQTDKVDKPITMQTSNWNILGSTQRGAQIILEMCTCFTNQTQVEL